MSEYNTEFPQSSNKYLKPADFQDQPTTLTYMGWEKKGNETDPPEKKNAKDWKAKLKYQLAYSYPEWAVDEANEKKIGRDGQPFQNMYWDPQYPHGYSILYHFEEGDLETGSKPLFELFCIRRPKVGEELVLKRTGEGKETKWTVTRKALTDNVHPVDAPEIQMDANEMGPDEEVPF